MKASAAISSDCQYRVTLRMEWKFTNFVEKNGGAAGLLEPADAPGDSAGKGASLVAKKLALQQGFGDGGAVNNDHRCSWMSRIAKSVPR
jgi:hypothetical protein